MAIKARRLDEDMLTALIVAHNQQVRDSISTTYFHLSRKEITGRQDSRSYTLSRDTVATANATDGPTGWALANVLRKFANEHFADDTAHDSAVSAQIATAVATDVTSGITLANAIKAAYNTHRSASNVHFNNDSTNATSAADATDATTLVTLVNELKTDLNAHVASAPPGTVVDIVPA